MPTEAYGGLWRRVPQSGGAMATRLFQVEFDNPLAAYVAGEQVTGRVYLRLQKDKRFRGIELKFAGQAVAGWSESYSETRNGRTHRSTVYFTAREVYFENKFFIAGGPNGEITLPPGEYIYPFVLILPPTIPSSFEGTLGHVRYTLKVVMIRPWRFDHESKVAFTVLSPLDLNFHPHLQECTQQTVEKHLWCLCCKSRPIPFVATTPYTGFVPGQKCYITLEVDNPTTNPITSKLALYQLLTYTASCGWSTKSQLEKIKLLERNIDTVEKSSTKTMSVELEIPSLPPSYLMFCSCINIDYSIVIFGSAGGMHTDAVIEIPIVIGSIPFRAHFALILPSAPVQPAPDQPGFSGAPAPDGRPMPAPSFPAYPDIPPPSYAECVSGKVNIRTEDDTDRVDGNLEFAPVYPMYHFK